MDLKSQFDASQKSILNLSLLRQTTAVLIERLANPTADKKTIGSTLSQLEAFVAESMDEQLNASIDDIKTSVRSFINTDQPGRNELLKKAATLNDGLAQKYALTVEKTDEIDQRTFNDVEAMALLSRESTGLAIFLTLISTVFLYVFTGRRVNSMRRQLEVVDLKKPETFSSFKVDSSDELTALELAYQDLLARLKQALDETEFERARSLQNAKLASLGELAAGVAHEINNPLAIIERSLHKFVGHPEKFKEKVVVIEKAVQRAAKIVAGLKKFSRSSGPKERVTRSICDIFSEVKILTEAKSKRHGVPVEIDCDSAALISCDELEIEQVFINFINNAIDAVTDKSEKWVRVHAFVEDREVVVQFRDAGRGIPKDIAQKLFQPFFTTKPVGTGTGLGLSISKGIIDEHGGGIKILESDPNTCFELRFPMASEALDAA